MFLNLSGKKKRGGSGAGGDRKPKAWHSNERKGRSETRVNNGIWQVKPFGVRETFARLHRDRLKRFRRSGEHVWSSGGRKLGETKK